MLRFSIFGGNAKTIENLLLHIDFRTFLGYSDTFINLLPILLLIIFRNKINNEVGLKIIVAYCCASFAINFFMPLLPKEFELLYEVFTFIEFSLFTSFIYYQLRNPLVKKYLLRIVILFLSLFVVYTITKGVKGFDSIPTGIEAIIVLGFCFYFLYEKTSDTTTLFIYNTYHFWVILGMALYLAGNFFIYIFASYLRNEDFNQKYWFITNIFSIIKTIFFCIAIIIHTKPPSKESINYNLELSRLN